jgi:glycosyltransferase involved in cell wall biosynthesis
MKKLLLIGSNSIHTFNYFRLIEDYFDEIILITGSKNEFEAAKLVHKYSVFHSLKNPFNYFAAIKKYQRILIEEKPDIIHIQQISTYSFLLLKALRKLKLSIPVVVTAWGSDVLLTPQKGWFYKKMVQYVLKQGDEFTADGQFLANEMQKLTSRKIRTTIANFGINVENIPIQKEDIIYSNRLLEPLYRIDKIMIAFSKFLLQYPEWKLVIAATGYEMESLKQLCKTLEIESKVEFLGWVDAKTNSENYAKAKIWVSIPKSDAASISLLEAMYLGCIPILSNLPTKKEWIQDQVTGILIDDVNSSFLERFTEIEYEQMVKLNQKLIAEKGTKEVNRKIFLEVYQKLLH